MTKLPQVLLALSLLVAPRLIEAKTLRVVTSIDTFADLARRIGGDRVTVESLSRGYQDPHFVEPKPSLVVALSRADLLVHVGLDLEIGWLPPLVLSSRNARIQAGAPGDVDASTGIPVLDVPTAKVDRSMGDIHPMGNPHYWIPPDHALIIAREIATRLKQLAPTDAALFDRNLVTFANELGHRRQAWETRAAPLRGKKVVTYHKSWSYLSRWLNLVEVDYLEPKPGIPASPSHIAKLIGDMLRDGVKLVLVESFYPRRTAELVAQKANARLVVLPSDVGADPSIKDYFALVDAVVSKLGGSEAVH